MEQRVVPAQGRGAPGTKIPTAREINVLVALAEHGDGRRASEAIGVSYQTLRNTLVTLNRKLGVSSSLQAYHVLRMMETPDVP